MDWFRRQRLAEDYRLVFTTEAGGRVLADLARHAGLNRDLVAADPLALATMEGRRQMARRVLAMIHRPVEQQIAEMERQGHDHE